MLVQAPATADQVSGGYIAALAALDPIAATRMGVPGHDHRLTDYSPEGHRARAELARQTRRQAAAIAPAGRRERLALAVLNERLGAQLALDEAGLTESALSTASSPVQSLRTVFTHMPAQTAGDWSNIRDRMDGMAEALSGVRRCLERAAARGQVTPRGEVLRVAGQCSFWAGDNDHGLSPFEAFAARAWRVRDVPVLAVQAAAMAAARAFGEFAEFLRRTLAPMAPEADAIGPDAYELWLRYHLGADADPVECYEWGLAELNRAGAQARALARRISPGTTPAGAAAQLDSDPRYQVHGPEAYLEWLQQRADEAIAYLAGRHFDISPEMSVLECVTSMEPEVPVFYTAPSAGFGRPGRLWWAIPGSGPFSVWRDQTRIHHEGAPGHHLQRAALVDQGSRLNAFQRLAGEVDGHGEGWAVSAEDLMAQWGRLDDDGFRFGWLDGHLLRSARVVADIGLHLALPVPDGAAGQRWTPGYAVDFLAARTTTSRPQCRYEVNRYLGWPGQAPCYKLGGRAWHAAREEARSRLGGRFDPRAFHREALALGPVGLDLLGPQLTEACAEALTV